MKKPVRRANKKPKVEKPVGVVTHYYTKIKVAVIKCKALMKIGTSVRFEGATTSFRQKIASLQLNHISVSRAQKGKSVGMKVARRVREGDRIYLDT